MLHLKLIKLEPATTGKGKTSNYLMRAGFNFGCTIVELVRSDLKLCQNECDDRPDCSSLQWSESGFCALKNCLTDTIIKGDVGETFYVKGDSHQASFYFC